jgi:hypothetical protein
MNTNNFGKVVNQLLARIAGIRDNFLTPNVENQALNTQNRPPRQSTSFNEVRSTNSRDNN